MPPTPSVPVIKTVVFAALMAPPAATADAIADILSLSGTSQMKTASSHRSNTNHQRVCPRRPGTPDVPRFQFYRGQRTPADHRAVARAGQRGGRAGAGARDDRRARQPAAPAGDQVEGDRGAADGVAPAGSNQPIAGDDPRDRPDRRAELRAQSAGPEGVPLEPALAAWIGITPRENSTAGRQRLGKISRAGGGSLRQLLVLGATAVIQQAI